jgi:hypothetical protein
MRPCGGARPKRARRTTWCLLRGGARGNCSTNCGARVELGRDRAAGWNRI